MLTYWWKSIPSSRPPVEKASECRFWLKRFLTFGWQSLWPYLGWLWFFSNEFVVLLVANWYWSSMTPLRSLFSFCCLIIIVFVFFIAASIVDTELNLRVLKGWLYFLDELFIKFDCNALDWKIPSISELTAKLMLFWWPVRIPPPLLLVPLTAMFSFLTFSDSKNFRYWISVSSLC